MSALLQLAFHLRLSIISITNWAIAQMIVTPNGNEPPMTGTTTWMLISNNLKNN